VHSYSVAKMAATLKQAIQSAERGLKVIIADGECMLVRQRRIRVAQAEQLKRGARVVKTRYGVDDELCTGDHSCIRLSGCPSLTVKPNPDPLRSDPVATVIESCVGCGLCGEVAHAAVLCPSFYRADIVTNPNWWDRTLAAIRNRVIAWLSRGSTLASLQGTSVGEDSPSQRRGEVQFAKGDQGSSGRPIVKPISILIAALGGEGGGVLTDWIVAAAASQGFPVQSTSIPGVAQRTGATTYHAMAVNSRSISGYLRFAALAKLRPLRRKTFRFRQEQEAIEAWLRLTVQAASLSAQFAVEIAECAGLIKGYGDTHRRGSANYNAIAAQVIAPTLAGVMPARHAVDAVASARTAALVDPEGEALAKCLAGLASAPAHAIAAE
jgi:NAD-dependent dihydropyrimidine dehydrogenase PreA subunit